MSDVLDALLGAIDDARCMGADRFHWPETLEAAELEQLGKRGVYVRLDERGVDVLWEYPAAHMAAASFNKPLGNEAVAP